VAPSAAELTGEFGVHVASYRTEKQAKVEVATLATHGFKGQAYRTDLAENGIWYRVFVGPYATQDEAQRARAVLLKLPEYKYAQVRRVPRQ
jgi:cell division protein FtsN